MALSAGTRLGPYEVLGFIGAGGMGEVYKARDTRLDRTVAIKVLSGDASQGPEGRARFEREARTIATLNHAHICTLHDVGEHGGALFLVMEHLDGETLAERLRRGPLPIQAAVRIAMQMAEAIAAAHDQGIIHRDLKPGNVMLTKSGVKLLDFGIAKLRPSAAAAGLTTSAIPTQEPSTLADAAFGTIPYISPEQLEGREADARSDIFAFGAVLYEMLTGTRAFRSESHAGVVAAILASDRPSPLRSRAGIPLALDRLVVTCLAKDPAERWDSARDIARHLATSLEPVIAPPATRRHGAWAVIAMLALVAIAGALAGLFWAGRDGRGPARSVTRLSFPLPPESLLAPNNVPASGASVAISRDGRTVAFVAARGGTRTLGLYSLESGAFRTLPGTQDAMSPFFSPDGQWIAFFTKTTLRKISIQDGTPITICETPPVTRGGVWAPDGTIYFSPSFSAGLQSVPSAGGVARDVSQVQFDAGESNHLLPDMLPDGKTLLFTVWNGGSFKDASIWSQSLLTGDRKRLADSATAPRFVSDGYLAFAREGVLFAVVFDPARAAPAGDVFPVVDGVWTDAATGTAHYAVAQNGTLVFAPGKTNVEERRLVWVDRTGHAAATKLEPNAYGHIRLSPDGRRVAVELLNDIWVYDLETGARSRATYRSVNQFPVWSPDGLRMAVSATLGVGVPSLFSVPAEGGGAAERLTHGGGVQFPGSWSADGRRIAYAERGEQPSSNWDIRVFDRDRPETRGVAVQTPFADETPMISPDGRALAYVSDEAGRPEVYVRPFPDPGARLQVSTDGGTEPVWSRSTGELFFRSARKMLAARVQTQGPLAVGRPSVLFEGEFAQTPAIPQASSYDVAPDGRFLMVVRSGEQPLPRILQVVLNWPGELARRTPRRVP
jgi:eukaryotic-like serine/threonine-protein kinase